MGQVDVDKGKRNLQSKWELRPFRLSISGPAPLPSSKVDSWTGYSWIASAACIRLCHEVESKILQSWLLCNHEVEKQGEEGKGVVSF